MRNRYLYISVFILAASVAAMVIFSHKKPVYEDLAPETKPTVIID